MDPEDGTSAASRGWQSWAITPEARPSWSGWAARCPTGWWTGRSARCTRGRGSSARDRELIILACLVTLGGCEPQVAAHIQALRAMDVPFSEIEETILQTTPYAGVPRAINALKVLRTEEGR